MRLRRGEPALPANVFLGCVESRGTYKGFDCKLENRISNYADQLMVRVTVRRCRAYWLLLGESFYRGCAHVTLVSDDGGVWPEDAWDWLTEALDECWAAVSKPYTAEETGLV